MNMSDAATGQILWQDDDWGDLLTEREIHIPARILRCAAVSREFQFSSVEMLQGLRLEQRIFFKGNLMEGAPRGRPHHASAALHCCGVLAMP
jgi:retinal rod rhodopsin-sensitive cGMP 3',5'-cyclic phosphodiesterase subunit delta